MLCHELGHLLAVRLCGGHLRTLRLEAAGLRMDATPPATRTQALLYTAAGPAAGLLWSAAVYPFGGWGIRSAAASLVLTGFNLLPARPLDGGEMLFILSQSQTAVEICSWAVAALLTVGLVRWKAWGLLAPLILIIKTAVSS